VTADPVWSLEIAKHMIMAKAFNTRWLFGLMLRDYEEHLDKKFIADKTNVLKKHVGEALAVKDKETLREVKKNINREWYSSFDDLIVNQKEAFKFKGRQTKRPIDRVNAMLTLTYEFLEELCTSALESAGLDSCAGFFLGEKPGQPALVLELMEEFRAGMADKLVLMMINEEKIGPDAFEEVGDNDFVLTDEGVEAIWEYWLELNSNKTMHPYLEEYVEWGLVPHASSILLTKYLLDEIEKYPPFLRRKPGL